MARLKLSNAWSALPSSLSLSPRSKARRASFGTFCDASATLTARSFFGAAASFGARR